ncbi:hypothetical protein A7U60_g6803 [Sanghuangporus baumii]|uniref:Uncharacterized protein n=1 Tax=Sanghuangporus baumii TaxID=108892 RepID=A0A9Q5HUJ4_SANBA|nr:hypothetical protein A7U60_g6803 [Sanghuangporus baumii]
MWMWPCSFAGRSSPPIQISRRILVPASPTLRRAMSNSSSPNSSGLPPQQSKALPERSVEPTEEKIISAIKDTTYEAYAKDAVFKDPVGIAEGVESIEAQFNGLAKVILPRADIQKFRVLKSPDSLPPRTILIDQDVAYFRDPSSSSPTKVDIVIPTRHLSTLNSLLTISTNEQYQITRHVEEWDHQRDTSKEDGFFGLLNDQRKKITASLVNKIVGSNQPKDD